jgi:peptidoglycan hydrolase-like protein with peptidoglycan-binding domain
MEGDSAKAMQILLIGYEFPCGSAGADGIFGKDTETALRLYQSANGLQVDGACGPRSWAKLLGY